MSCKTGMTQIEEQELRAVFLRGEFALIFKRSFLSSVSSDLSATQPPSRLFIFLSLVLWVTRALITSDRSLFVLFFFLIRRQAPSLILIDYSFFPSLIATVFRFRSFAIYFAFVFPVTLFRIYLRYFNNI